VEEPIESCNLLVIQACCRLGAYACQHACTRHSKQSSDRGWLERYRTMGKRAAQVLSLYSPQSQAINEFTGNTVWMRTCTHTVLHYAQCVSACPRLCLVEMRASTHSAGNPDKPPRGCGWKGKGRWGSMLQHVIILHLLQSQAINEVTENTVRMRACMHTVLHFV
jgi:hypothetical protein